jgi:serine/threonine protein kinase
VLARLATAPAAWADDTALKAVSKYHSQLVALLTREGLLHQLPRRLRWGRFLILAELGRGGMGVVFLGWDSHERKLVALKRMCSASRETRTRFQRETQVLARLKHAGIAQFLGAESIEGADVLIMEYVPGITASRTVRRLGREGKHLPWESATNWALQTLSALAHAHEERIVHRDIKPGNLMVMPGGRKVKLLDMGLAKCLDEPAGADTVTRDGQALGTREYMPPEQWQWQPVTPAADLYALGCTLFSLLAGRPPYEGDTSYRQMTQHLSAPVPSVRQVRPDVPAAVDQVIQRLMAKNPAHRGTAREINWVLSRAVSVAPVAAAATVPAAPAQLDPGSGTSGRGLSAPSAARVEETAEAHRVTQTTLSGSSCWELTSELAAEARRLVRSWIDGKAGQNTVAAVSPTRRLREVGSELGRALWDGLRGRRPDAARPAWLALGGSVLALAVLFLRLSGSLP